MCERFQAAGGEVHLTAYLLDECFHLCRSARFRLATLPEHLGEKWYVQERIFQHDYGPGLWQDCTEDLGVAKLSPEELFRSNVGGSPVIDWQKKVRNKLLSRKLICTGRGHAVPSRICPRFLHSIVLAVASLYRDGTLNTKSLGFLTRHCEISSSARSVDRWSFAL